MNRRYFLKYSAAAGLYVGSIARAGSIAPKAVSVQNTEPERLVRKAVELLGGIQRFIQPGQVVLVKPNMGWDRVPEQAATTNPDAVAEMVRLCRDAGAKRVVVRDRTCNHARRCYRNSGIEAAARQAGGQVRHLVDVRFQEIPIPNGKDLSAWPVYQDVLEADVLINMPIAKVHTISGVTLGMKNLMGCLGGDRGKLHKNFAEKIVDINTVLVPSLTIIDAYRILTANGPSGGDLKDVKKSRTVFAGTDPVAVDALAARLLGFKPDDLEYLVNAQTRGLGMISPDVNPLSFDFN